MKILLTIISLLITTIIFSQNSKSESIFIGNFNPFSNEDTVKKILNGKVITEYNSNLKDGDIYFVYSEEKVKEWALNTINQNFVGKSFRVYSNDKLKDEVFTLSMLTDIKIRNTITPQQQIQAPIHKSLTVFTYASGNQQMFYCNGKINYFYFTGDKRLPDTNSFNTNEETSNKVKEIINNTLLWEDVPNEFFELRQVQRVKTDF